ncbi:endonuclease/exonuclease/phosphatase (EEP) superfamily protein YafD [Arthrobacter sp. PvP102]|uniref:endonuclease/exonuclease/phosphatase family protein n=1 Tax=unclassified Arthrobacter TaxID=235627 RepID=UPI001AE864B7|nr:MULTISPECIES: endonuclease/exonuclease/phosphatase family protein [unclassified Arthrobacter]MBP1231702.1 endonuclease/exonuclease/phosphatase (EEP) superfamily protein YafD [Arthrobacter sp. PvP103]MBP1236837.1 endonuclease/exonuclease/phosphatase (EEP) superfamily protein YafD [Arthrobacter sp. PvP102]
MTFTARAVAGVRPRSRWSAVWAVAAVLLALPVAVLSVFRAVPVEWPTLAVQLLSFTPWLLIPAGAAVLLAIPGRRRFLIWVTAALAAAQVFWLFPLDHGRSITEAGGPAAKLTAMTINSEFGQAEAAGIVRLVRENGVGLLTVQEHSRALEDRLAAAGLSGLLPYRISSPTDDGGDSAIYSAHRLEAVGVLPDTPFHMPIVRLTVEGAGAPAVLEVTNVHALPPVDVRVDQWRSDLAALARLSVRPGNRLLIGDFNATYDHAEFRALLDVGPDGRKMVDVGTAAGLRLEPTWPMEGHRLPGIAIDHQVTSPGIAASGYAVHRVPGTDHAAVLATLSLPTGR